MLNTLELCDKYPLLVELKADVLETCSPAHSLIIILCRRMCTTGVIILKRFDAGIDATLVGFSTNIVEHYFRKKGDKPCEWIYFFKLKWNASRPLPYDLRKSWKIDVAI